LLFFQLAAVVALSASQESQKVSYLASIFAALGKSFGFVHFAIAAKKEKRQGTAEFVSLPRDSITEGFGNQQKDENSKR
jgi:hypothetical protein